MQVVASCVSSARLKHKHLDHLMHEQLQCQDSFRSLLTRSLMLQDSAAATGIVYPPEKRLVSSSCESKAAANALTAVYITLAGISPYPRNGGALDMSLCPRTRRL